MIEKKLQETDPEGTGYCVGGKLSIVDLFVRAASVSLRRDRGLVIWIEIGVLEMNEWGSLAFIPLLS